MRLVSIPMRICLLLTCCLLAFSRCGLSAGGDAEALGELAYDVNPRLGYKVYLNENGTYVPYLVLSWNYGGNTLLLREPLLAEVMPFKRNDTHLWDPAVNGAYYDRSSIDAYLNSEFIERFSPQLRDIIVATPIEITAESSLGLTGEESATIKRDVFLLSLREVGGESRASVNEGEPLKYFSSDDGRRPALLPDGERSAYWTRTPETWETYTVFTVGWGGIGSGSADIDSGVRPAFCLDPLTPVIQREGIVDGQSVYVLDI